MCSGYSRAELSALIFRALRNIGMAAVMVRNLYHWVDDKQLKHVFGAFGKVEDVDIISQSEPSNPESPKNGIIYFNLKDSALESVKQLNGTKTSIGCPLIIDEDWMKGALGQYEGDPPDAPKEEERPVTRNRRSSVTRQEEEEGQTLLFVKNFKDYLDERTLSALFRVYGNVKGVSIKKENGVSKGYGFIDFDTHASAKLAIKYMHGEEIKKGRRLYVSFAQRKDERGETHDGGNFDFPEQEKKKQNVVLYIRKLPRDITAETLKGLFEQYGTVDSVSVRSMETGSTAVGFVSFENPEEAQRAQMAMHGFPMRSRTLEVVVKAERRSRASDYAENGSTSTSSIWDTDMI